MSELLRVPLANPASDQASLSGEIRAAIEDVLAQGDYILGKCVRRFEAQMAENLGVSDAVGVASGTDALVLALSSLRVSSGDEVVTVSHTAGPTVAAIRMLDARPVLVDIEPDMYCLDPAKLDASIGPRTRAVLVVHLYGHPADMESILEISSKHGIPVVEDCAQAQGATFKGLPVGSMGDVGCFSFYPTKNLGAVGDGGLVVSRVPDVAARLRKLRTYGWAKPQFAELAGGRCSRLDELQAAILLLKLTLLDNAIARRRVIAHRYHAALSGLPITLPTERSNSRHSYHLYVIRSDCREALAKHLETEGISTGIHYPYPVHVQPGLSDSARIPEPLSVTERIASQILSIPLFPSMSEQQQGRVISAVRSFFANTISID